MPRKKSVDAINNPVIAAPKESNTADYKVPQRDTIQMDQGLQDREPIAIVDKLPDVEYMEVLKMAEDPVTVVLSASSDPKAAKVVPCWVNGKGAEVYDSNKKKWIEFKYLPVGKVIVVKRKYLEVLARSRVDTFATREVTPTPMANQDGYVLDANTVPTVPFSVRYDPAGERGQEWLARVMSEF